METAEPLAKQLNIPVVVRPDLAEMPALYIPVFKKLTGGMGARRNRQIRISTTA